MEGCRNLYDTSQLFQMPTTAFGTGRGWNHIFLLLHEVSEPKERTSVCAHGGAQKREACARFERLLFVWKSLSIQLSQGMYVGRGKLLLTTTKPPLRK